MTDTPTAPLRVGDVLKGGTCDGHFRGSYGGKRVEAIGADWVVCRDEYGAIQVATYDAGDTVSGVGPDYLIRFRTNLGENL